MPERTVTCGDCGESAKISDGDWNISQAPQVEAWEQRHAREDHQGNEISALQIEPNPMLG
jgi:hypothetical protein